MYVELAALSSIREDFIKYGRCDFAVVKEPGWSTPMSFAMPKNSPFLKDINRGYVHSKMCFSQIFEY